MKRFYGIPLIMAFAVSPLAAVGHPTPSQEICENIQHGEYLWISAYERYECMRSDEACINTEGGENRTAYAGTKAYLPPASMNFKFIDTNGTEQTSLSTSCISQEYCEYVGWGWSPTEKDCIPISSGTSGDSNTGSGDSGSGSETGGGSGSGSSSSSGTRFRVAKATHEASATIVTSGQYVKGAYNANVGNINTALKYVEDSAVETINNATVSANNLTLSVNGFTPSGTVSMDSTKATITGTVNVPTTVPALDTWGATTTQNATLSGTGTANINSGATLSGVTASFTGTASGNLTGSGSFNNAKVSVDDWYPVNPQ